MEWLHGGVLPVERRRLDDGESRTALCAGDEWVEEAAVRRVQQLARAFRAQRKVRRDGGKGIKVRDALAGSRSFFHAGRSPASSTSTASTRAAAGRLCGKPGAEQLHRFILPLHLGDDERASVLHEAREAQRDGQTGRSRGGNPRPARCRGKGSACGSQRGGYFIRASIDHSPRPDVVSDHGTSYFESAGSRRVPQVRRQGHD